MAYETTHILYEWEDYTEVEIAGKVRSYSNGPRSIIAHRLADIAVSYPQIPADAYKTPVRYSTYTEKWLLANGRELQLPHKLW